MKNAWGELYKLYVIRGFTTSKTQDGLTEMHLEARAFDISVVFTTDREQIKLPNHVLPRLAHMAFYNANFKFVKYVTLDYLHVSCVCKGKDCCSIQFIFRNTGCPKKSYFFYSYLLFEVIHIFTTELFHSTNNLRNKSHQSESL